VVFHLASALIGIDTCDSARNSRRPDTMISRSRMISAGMMCSPWMTGSPLILRDDTSIMITAATMILSAIGSRNWPSRDVSPCARAR